MQPGREFFIGAFTRDGYVFYDPITLLNEKDGARTRRVVVRGGTQFLRTRCMKRVAEKLQEKDMQIDIMASALDPNAIQSVGSAELGIAVIAEDDCSLSPSACFGEDDSTTNIDLDDAFHSDKPILLPYSDDSGTELIPALRAESQANERRACHLLAAAAALQTDAEEEWRDQLMESELTRVLEPWIQAVTAFRDPAERGRERKFFADAVTSRGIVKHLDTLEMPRQWRITGPWGVDVSYPLTRVRDAALSRGLDVFSSVDVVRPDRISHLLIPALGLFVTSEDDPGELSAPAQRSIDLRNVMPTHDVLSQNTLRAVAFDEMMYNELIDRAAFALDLSKKARERMDAHLEKRVDLARADRIISEAIEQIL
ncbi:MAG: hypothetical protein LBD16_00890 [Oscillospiraceae bacterium]|jgi:hypothetical protein|nr:hypothetical protein [Oscillospiraceae bacterium]